MSLSDPDVEWVKRIADRLESEERYKNLENERFAEEKLRRHHAPRLWMRLKTCLEERCQSLNVKLGKDIFLFKLEPTSQAIIRTKGGPRLLRVVYSEDPYRIYYESNGLNGQYLFPNSLIRPSNGVDTGFGAWEVSAGGPCRA